MTISFQGSQLLTIELLKKKNPYKCLLKFQLEERINIPEGINNILDASSIPKESVKILPSQDPETIPEGNQNKE